MHLNILTTTNDTWEEEADIFKNKNKRNMQQWSRDKIILIGFWCLISVIKQAEVSLKKEHDDLGEKVK